MYAMFMFIYEFSYKIKIHKIGNVVILYCFVVKGKLISTKSLPPVGIEPAKLIP